MLVSSIRTHHPLVPLLPFSGVSRTVGGAKSPAGRLAGSDITLGRESQWWNTGCWLLDLQRPLGCWTMRFKLKSQPGSFRNFFLLCCFFVQSANQKKSSENLFKKTHIIFCNKMTTKKRGKNKHSFLLDLMTPEGKEFLQSERMSTLKKGVFQ